MVSNQKTYALFSGAESEKIATRLEADGSKVFRFAPVGIQKIDAAENSAIVKNDLHEFDWIIFPDVFAVDRFVEILDENAIDPFELDALRIFACGEAVADRLRFVQIHADVIPSSIDTKTFLSTLSSYDDDLKNKNFLIPKAANFEPEFPGELAKLGANVVEIAVYETRSGENDKTANLKALLKGGAIDGFIFDSPESVFSLRVLLDGENLPEMLRETEVLGANEPTLQTLRELRLNPRYFSMVGKVSLLGKPKKNR